MSDRKRCPWCGSPRLEADAEEIARLKERVEHLRNDRETLYLKLMDAHLRGFPMPHTSIQLLERIEHEIALKAAKGDNDAM